MFEHKRKAQPVPHFQAWRAAEDFPLDAKIKMLVVKGVGDNPTRWRPGSLGDKFYAEVLGPLTQGKKLPTVGDCIALACPDENGKGGLGYIPSMVQSHLKFLWTWGDQCEVGGRRYVAVVDIPTPKQQMLTPPSEQPGFGDKAREAVRKADRKRAKKIA